MDALNKVISETASFTNDGIKKSLSDVVGAAAISGVAFDKINKNVLRYMINRLGADDLVLSDRVWNFA
ncbi:hypothetical protein QKW52_29090 [Bacillus sonorensis]|nr:hypothetical protein [Bacillus sonorensis]